MICVRNFRSIGEAKGETAARKRIINRQNTNPEAREKEKAQTEPAYPQIAKITIGREKKDDARCARLSSHNGFAL